MATVQSKKQVPVKEISISNTIYADSISAIMFGPGVSKIVFSLEDFGGVNNTFTSLVLPTSSLLELVDQISNGLENNAEMREGLIAGLDELKRKLTSKATSD